VQKKRTNVPVMHFRWITAVVAGAVLVVLAAALLTGAPRPIAGTGEAASADPVRRGCALDDRLLARLWRGFDAERSEDIIVVPREPNYFGSFAVTSHTGPWDYVQEIPLVLYGPGFIRSGVAPVAHASITDVYPTVGKLLHIRLPAREGVPLNEALEPRREAKPELIVVVVWDGVGRNVLERWPGRWPNLERLQRAGTGFVDAAVGSSPSITPASHASLGTGSWPRTHGVTAIRMRVKGRPDRSFRGLNPSVLRRTTFADEVDRAFGNRSLVGLIGWQTWHLGMLGHGAASPGGDRDIVGIIHKDGRVVGNPSFYRTPADLSDSRPGLARRLDQTDRDDGAADGEWLGHDVALKQTPAWVNYETDILLRLLKHEGFGIDKVPDILLANFKMSDVAGHYYTLDSEEMAEVLEAQDEALGKIVDHLESVGTRFVLVLTADHGHTPSPDTTGAWPISQTELVADLDRRFGLPGTRSLVQKSHAAGYFVDRVLMDRLEVDELDIARWLNEYTIGDNTPDALPPSYEDRAGQRIFAAAFPGSRMDEVMDCAFGSSRPPRSLDA
jgi:hypothetical protein